MSKVDINRVCDTEICIRSEGILCIEVRTGGILSLERAEDQAAFTIEGRRCVELMANNCSLSHD